MRIPTYRPSKMVDDNGYPHPDTQLYNDLLNQQIQQNLSDEGFVIPAQTTTTIQNLTDPTNPNAKGAGTLWYDSTLNKYVGYENGVLVKFTTTPV